MGKAIGDILSSAVGVAISPVPIIAVILILFSKRARSNGTLFLVGWVLALATLCTVVMLIGSSANIATSSGPSKGSAVIRIVLGALLLVAAGRQWKKRPRKGEEAKMPKWMEGLEEFNSLKSFIMAVALAALNPKNLILTLAAAMAITQDAPGGLGAWQPWISMIVFVVIASSTVGVAVFTYLIGGKKAEKVLTTWKTWLTANNATVMFVLLLVFGAVVIGKGITGL
jgi:threonine/homoserine/homoserine lactone efflux protein